MVDQSLADIYELAIQPRVGAVDEVWFAEQFRRCRAGDHTAVRRISERCLAKVLEIAKSECGRLNAGEHLLDALQVGNAALVDAITQCHGGEFNEFSRHMATTVRNQICGYLTAQLLGFGAQ